MQYRSEVDGLRAVAVLAVMFFHAGFDWASGGFVGVDVFFVISGYLIATIIIQELEQGRFSLWHFYERRIRRILPALFLVLACTIPLAWLLLPPNDLKDFFESLTAIVFFAPNVLFYTEGSYFARALEMKPLLHTWSLGVEEQFYCLFPLFMLVAWRARRKVILVLLLLMSLLSLGLSHYFAATDPNFNFFMPFTRAWELLIGCLCALIIGGKARPNNLLSAFGLGCITLSILLYHKHTPIPSIYAILPVGGAALIILFAGPQTWVARWLSYRWMVVIGLLSFSAYLWHNPIFVFARFASLHEPSAALWCALGLLSFALAWLSWRFVEQPFRRKQNGRYHLPSHKAYPALAAMACLLAAIGAYGHLMQGFPTRTSMGGERFNTLQYDAKFDPNYGLAEHCGLGQCQHGDTPNVLLWGDSVAMQLAEGLVATQRISFIQSTSAGCPPFTDLTYYNRFRGPEKCLLENDRILAWLASEDADAIKTVILSFAHPDSFEHNRLYVRDRGWHAVDTSLLKQHLEQLITALNAIGKQVMLVSPPPTNGTHLGRCLQHALLLGRALSQCNFAKDAMSEASMTMEALFAQFAGVANVISLYPSFCSEHRCRTVTDDDIPLYRDGIHVTIAASRSLIANAFTDALLTSD